MDEGSLLLGMGKLLRQWVNHSKEDGARRSKSDLRRFDNELWEPVRRYMASCENSSATEDRDFVRLVKRTGRLYRIHKAFCAEKERFGVLEEPFPVSWSWTNGFSDVYWVYPDEDYLLIEAVADDEQYGIDLVGLAEFMNTYWLEGYELGSQALEKEREVVFPLLFDNVTSMKVIRFH